MMHIKLHETRTVPKQTVTLRLDEDDLTFLSQVEITGAANLSEKIRTLISEARAQREGMHDPAAAHDFARRLFARVDRQVHAAEMEHGLRSELVHRVMAWLPDITAFALSACRNSGGDQDTRASLQSLESGLAERSLSLSESIEQLGKSGFRGCYRPEALAKRANFGVQSDAGDE
ncbi:MAG: hypothetical protein EA370_05935 [Wenzhouxiangella sp.]|nr:MAG: hypothetical protein EA370_05935 [Wenzhouxiangella sp.]